MNNNDDKGSSTNANSTPNMESQNASESNIPLARPISYEEYMNDPQEDVQDGPSQNNFPSAPYPNLSVPPSASAPPLAPYSNIPYPYI